MLSLFLQEKTTEIFGKIQFGLPFAESLDILAFVFQITVVVIISCNVFCSSIINTILGIITSSVLVFVFIAGLVYGDVRNFTNVGHGGFFPFGIAGVIKGASLAIYATSGFEIVSLSAEVSISLHCFWYEVQRHILFGSFIIPFFPYIS